MLPREKKDFAALVAGNFIFVLYRIACGLFRARVLLQYNT